MARCDSGGGTKNLVDGLTVRFLKTLKARFACFKDPVDRVDFSPLFSFYFLQLGRDYPAHDRTTLFSLISPPRELSHRGVVRTQSPRFGEDLSAIIYSMIVCSDSFEFAPKRLERC